MNRSMLLLLFLISLASCSNKDNGSPAPSTGTIEGRVSTAIGDTSIVGARVTILPGTTAVNTTSQGTYSIPDVAAGQYEIQAEKVGYNPAPNSIAVTGGRTTTANFRLTRISGSDLMSPAAVHDLVAYSAADSSITISWTATGDDSITGTVAVDLIYYAGDSISVVTQPRLMYKIDLVDVQPSGTIRSHVVTGLSIDQVYFFGHRSVDDAGNWSGLSNIAHARPFAPGPRRVWRVPADAATIQAAADRAGIADTILVASGTYVGPGNRDIDLRGKRLALVSAEGASVTIIDCQGLGRGINIRNRDGPGVLVRGFTIRNGDVTSRPGYDNDGGGICGASFALADCVLENNRAEDGGGMFCGGDAIRIDHCVFRDNVASYGGGLYTEDAYPIIQDCVFEGNTAANVSGGIHVNEASITLTRCTIVGNSAGGEAGAFSMGGQPAWSCVMEDCVIDRNSSGGSIGGIDLGDLRSATFLRCSIANNTGIGLSRYYGFEYTLSIDQCTIVGNGSGIYLELNTPGLARLNQSIVAFSSEGASLTRGGGYYGNIDISCCDIFGNVGGDWVPRIQEQYGINGNISSDPLFCNLGGSDFRLDVSSPCSGDVSGCGKMGAFGVGCSKWRIGYRGGER